MQQSYRALRIIAEAQTIRIVLAPEPGELMLNELCIVCDSIHTESSSGIKAVVLDFNPTASHLVTHGSPATTDQAMTVVERAREAIYTISQPVLAVVRSTLSQPACLLTWEADFTLAAEDAVLMIPNKEKGGEETLTGTQALRLGYITWATSANDLNKHMERILDLLRTKSAVALRHTKESVHLANTNHATSLEALQHINAYYLTQLMQTADAQEGLLAFLEKRKPGWKNM